MQGIGEILTPVPTLPECGIVLVNPHVEVPTGAVFKGVKDRNPPPGPPLPDRFDGFTDFVQWLRLQRNDLQPSAEAACPAITQVLKTLSDAPLARMSGSGATCFALFQSASIAKEMALQLGKHHPGWWIEPGTI
jgi:4-diphosphocytidyl-2-C-methyl-D-erythritol kinase